MTLTFDERRTLKAEVSALRLERQLQLDAELIIGDERYCELCHQPFVMNRLRQRFCCEAHRLKVNRSMTYIRRSRAAARMRRYYEQKAAA